MPQCCSDQYKILTLTPKAYQNPKPETYSCSDLFFPSPSLVPNGFSHATFIALNLKHPTELAWVANVYKLDRTREKARSSYYHKMTYLDHIIRILRALLMSTTIWVQLECYARSNSSDHFDGNLINHDCIWKHDCNWVILAAAHHRPDCRSPYRVEGWVIEPWSKSSRATVLSSMVVYLAMAVDLPPWAIKEIDEICRRSLWRGRKEINGGLG